MKSKTPRSLILTEIFLYILAVCLLALDVFLWPLSGWYMQLRQITGATTRIVLVVVLYACSLPGWMILFELFRLIRNMKRGSVFVDQNVGILRIVSYSCLLVGIITFAGGFFYQPFFFVTVAALFLTLIVRVVKNVLQQAIDMKDELDFTV